jgi:hypothetical protein
MEQLVLFVGIARTTAMHPFIEDCDEERGERASAERGDLVADRNAHFSNASSRTFDGPSFGIAIERAIEFDRSAPPP